MTAIGRRAFVGCSCLDTIVIPDGIKIIDVQTFQNCVGLKQIVLPNSMLLIEDEALAGCENMETLTLPASLRKLDFHCLGGCIGLKKITNYATTPQEVFQPFYNDDQLPSITLEVPKGCSAAYKADSWWGRMNVVEME